MSPRTRLLLLASAGLAMSRAVPARADGIEVSPVVIELTPGARQAVVTLHNGGAEPSRFRIAMLSWSQGLDGAMKLGPTRDVAFFPELMTLKSSETRAIRIAAVAPAGQVEGTYRLVIEELPPAATARAPGTVRMLTRLSIPVFLEPAKPAVARGTIEGLAVRAGKLGFRLRNPADVRIRPRRVAVRAVGAGGEVVFEKQLSAWYVLARSERDYDLSVPGDDCGRVRSFIVEASLENDTLGAKLDTPGGACGP